MERFYDMDSFSVLKEFAGISEKCSGISSYIVRQDPMRYEGEYGADFICWSDENLKDFFIDKLGFYKMFSLGNVMGRYHAFFDYCFKKGYIPRQPFEKSMYLSYDYLIRSAAEAGNVPFYSRDYIRTQCSGQGEIGGYCMAAAFAVYEGIKDYKRLAAIRVSDVDFTGGRIKGFDHIRFSSELMKLLYAVKGDEYVIPDSPLTGRNGPLERENRHRIISNRLQKTGLKQTGLYDSGLIQRLSEELGEEGLLQYLFYDGSGDKSIKIQSNKRLSEVFQKLGIEMSVKNFVYDYRVYGLCIQYGLRN